MKRLEDSFTVVYLDTRGSGRSEKPAELTSYRHEDLVADLEALRKHLGQEKVWVAGHSEGGWMAMHYAVAYPDGCAGLLLIDAIYAHDDDWRKDGSVRQDRRRSEPWYEKVKKALADHRAAGTEKSFDVAMSQSLMFAFHDVANMEKLNKTGGTLSSEAFKGRQASNKDGLFALPLENIRVPVLIIVGASDDRCSPRQAQRIHLGIAGSKLLVVEEAGHFPWLEQPENFFNAVERGLLSLGVKVQ
jgi:proline iminopeptidase